MSSETDPSTNLPPQGEPKKVLSAEKQKKKDAKEAKKLKALQKQQEREKNKATEVPKKVRLQSPFQMS